MASKETPKKADVSLNPNKRFEGIVTPVAVEKLRELVKPENFGAIKQLLVAQEPHFVEDSHTWANENRDKFKRMLGSYMTQAAALAAGRTGSSAIAVPGELLDEIYNVIMTAQCRGFLGHREAIRIYDAKKLDELYKMDYDAYLDQLLAEGLKRKEGEAKRIDSVQPDKPHSTESLLDE